MAKTFIIIFMVIGSYAGSLIPLAWGENTFSFSSIIFSAIGGIIGIWLGFKISQNID
jgi:hypothetical protein